MPRVARYLVALLSVTVLLVAMVRAGVDSPLIKPVKEGDLEAVRKLIASGADVNGAVGDGSTPLLWAVHNSDIDMVKALIAAGAKPNTANNYGVTPLLDASRTGDAAVMELLLKAGADPTATHLEGETTLMAAARSGSVPAVKLLLDKGVDINAVDKFQSETALMWASSEGHAEVVDTLLKAGANADLKARVSLLTDRKNADHPTGGFTALMWAARNGHDDTLRVLAKGGADLNLKNGDNASAIMISIWNYRFDTAAVLAELGADVNDGALYTAVEMRDSTTDQFAFDGSRLRPSNKNKRTNLELIQLLLDKGADPLKPFSGQFHSASMPNSERFDNSPYFRSATSSDAEALRIIAKSLPNPDIIPVAPVAAAGPGRGGPGGGPAGGARGGPRGNPNSGRTALIVAMGGGRAPAMTGGPGYIRSGDAPYREPGSRKPADAVAALLEVGANPNQKGADGAPLLHQAAQTNNLSMIRALAKAGVNFSETNAAGLTALDVAEGRQPAGGGGAARGGGRGGPGGLGAPRGGGVPPVGAPRGARGAPGAGAANPRETVKLLRELMGLPPAPPAPAGAAPAAAPAEAAESEEAEAEPADGDGDAQ